MQAVQRERDLAIASLDRHGLMEQYQTDCQRVGGGAGEGHVIDPRDHMIQQLTRQKEELHNVVKQMRREMEQLTELSDQPANETAPKPDGRHKEDTGMVTTGYVKFLEKELSGLKSENRKLEEKLQESRKPPTPPPPSRERKTQSPSVERRHRGHLIALSDTIACLQRERGEMAGEVRRLEGELERREGRIRELSEQVSALY